MVVAVELEELGPSGGSGSGGGPGLGKKGGMRRRRWLCRSRRKLGMTLGRGRDEGRGNTIEEGEGGRESVSEDFLRGSLRGQSVLRVAD